MALLNVDPGPITQAAQSLARVGDGVDEVSAAAVGPTTTVPAMAADEVSTAIARQFGSVGQEFHALLTRAKEFHANFVKLMNEGLTAYSGAEVANGTALASAASPAAVTPEPITAGLAGVEQQIQGFVGTVIDDNSFIVGKIGNSMLAAGDVLVDDSSSALALANGALGRLSVAGVNDPTLGVDLAGGPIFTVDGQFERIVGGGLVNLGTELEQIGGNAMLFGFGLIPVVPPVTGFP